jgi:hypothetical protein
MTDEPQSAIPQAAIEAAAEPKIHIFNGKPLYPFNHARMTCWHRIGFEGAILSSYEALVAIVFICTLGDEIVDGKMTGMDLIRSTRDLESIRAFEARANEWVDSLHMTPKNAIGREANDVGYAIFKEMEDSRFTIVPTEGAAASPKG